MYETFFQTVSIDTMRIFSYLGGLFFIGASMTVIAGLPLNLSRQATRWVIVIGLAFASFTGMISGMTYIWHHFYR